MYYISEEDFELLNRVYKELVETESLNNNNITRDLFIVTLNARPVPGEGFIPKPGEGFMPDHNILRRADQIVNHRAEEKLRQYGPFGKAMRTIATCFSALTGIKLKPKHINLIYMIAKLQREAHSHKEDNLLDLVAYAAQLNNQEEGVEE